MNFPHATDADWTRARSRLMAFLIRHDLDPNTAEEVAQQYLTETLIRKYRDRCPASPAVAVGWSIARAKRYGIGTLTKGGERTRYRRRVGIEQPQPAADPVTVRDVSASCTNPATMAEAGESLAERMPRYAQRARARGMTPAALALVAAGWGPLDDDDAAKATPSVPQCGPGYTPPAEGVRGLWTDTDPNPSSRAAARAAVAAAAERVGLIVTQRAG